MKCDHWSNGQECGATDDVRHYLPGLRCPAHTPAALAGRSYPNPWASEPQPIPRNTAVAYGTATTDPRPDCPTPGCDKTLGHGSGKCKPPRA